MKKVHFLAYLMFIVAILWEIPNGAVIRISILGISLLMMLTVNITAIVRKEDIKTILTGFVATSWTVAWLFVAKQFPFSRWITGIAITLTTILLFKIYQNRLQNKLNSINENLKKQTIQLESAQEIIIKQNDALRISKENLEIKVMERTRELQQANNDLQMSNRELDTFVYRASHDIKGPIVTILGVCNVALMEAIDERDVKYFNMLSGMGKQLQNKLNRLLAINNLKHTVPKEEDVPLKGIIEHTKKAISSLNGFEIIDFSIKYPEQLILITDRDIIQTIIDNMVEYAVKNSLINPDYKPYIKINIKIDNNFRFFLTYNGVPIPDNLNQEIFKMFYRTTNNPELTGMELYTANLAIEKLDGSIELISSTEEETMFSIFLPNAKVKNQE